MSNAVALKVHLKNDSEAPSGGPFARTLAQFARLRRLRRPAAMDGANAELMDDARWRLAEVEVRLRALLDSQDALIVRRDDEDRVTFANRAFCEAFGVQLDELRGRPFVPMPLDVEDGALCGEGGSGKIALYATRKGHCWVQWETHALSSATGGREISFIGRDVTAERRAALALSDARDQAEAGSRAKSRFLAAMSHEIRTPMNGILGMASLLSNSQLTADQRTYVRAIDQSGRALLYLINEILDFSKIEAGKLQLVAAPFSLRGAIKSAFDLMAVKAKEKGNQLELIIGEDIPDILVGDQARFGQILLNLLSNAVKFTNQGTITVTVRREGERASEDGKAAYAFEVRDTGIGFSPETMELLFDEFEQAASAEGQPQGGTGLGLAISKRLAGAMSGDIRAEGELGKGATFTATLRFEELGGSAILPFDAAGDSNSSDERLATCAGARVLVAEDNDVNALLARRVCESAGATVTVAKNGREALELIEAQLARGALEFDVILMDVFMPDMDGLEASRAIKDLFQRSGVSALPIIALTAHAFTEDRLRCLAAGMDDYLAKPFDIGQLQAVIGRWVVAAGPAN